MSDTTDHNITLDTRGSDYVLTITGPIDGLDDLMDEMREGRIESELRAALGMQ